MSAGWLGCLVESSCYGINMQAYVSTDHSRACNWLNLPLLTCYTVHFLLRLVLCGFTFVDHSHRVGMGCVSGHCLFGRAAVEL